MPDWLIHHELERQAIWRGDAPAMWFEGRTYSYGEFDARVNRTARGLRGRGVETGDTVVVHGHNHVDLYTLFYACSKLGARFSPVSTFQSVANVEYICGELDPSYVFYTADEDIRTETLPTVRAAAPDAAYVCLDADAVGDDATFADLVADRSGERPAWSDDPVATTPHNVFWTSGTTGRPKGVVRDHHQSLHFADPLVEVMPFTPDTRRLISSNMMYVAPYLQHGIPTVVGGGTFFILRTFSPERVYRLVHEHDITVALFVATQMHLVFEYLEEHDVSFQLEYLHGGVRSAEEAKSRMALTDELVHIYATTEVGLPVAKRLSPPFDTRPALGKPGRSANVRVVEPDTDVTEAGPPSPGQEGEIAVRGGVTLSHFLDPDIQAEKVDDGWVYPGDVVRVNDAGELVFVGRADNRLRSGGINVQPEEVEAVLTSHEAVTEAVVVGVPDERWGDRICALVVTPVSDTEALEAELDAHCQASDLLVAELRPREYAFVASSDQIPTGALSKVSRDDVVAEFFK